jgi:hypothetical protein
MQLKGLLKRSLLDADSTQGHSDGIGNACQPGPPTDSCGSGSLPGFHNLRSYVLTHVQ